MKRILIISMVLLSLGMTTKAQTGKITRVFTMGNNCGSDTCYLWISFKNDKFDYVEMGINCEISANGKSTMASATIDGDPNLYHNYKTSEKRVQEFRTFLDSLKIKFEEWTRIAKENNVTNYTKNLDEEKDVPIFFVCARKDGKLYSQNSEVNVKGCSPHFTVGSDGSCVMSFGWHILLHRSVGETTGFYSRYSHRESYTPLVYFAFRSPEEMQKLIDALDIESARQQLLKENANGKKVDDLFK